MNAMQLSHSQIDTEARHLAAELGWHLAPAPQQAPTVAIVGGGPGSLFTAYLLQQKLPGAKVTIFEAGRRLGGKILTCAFSDGTPYEGGVAELYEYKSPEGKPDPFRQLIEEDLGLHTVNMDGGGVVIGDAILPDFDAVAAVYGPETRQALERFHAKCAELMPLEKYASRWQADNKHPAAPITGHAFVKQELGEFPHAERYARVAIHSDLAAEAHQCNGLNYLKNTLLDSPNYMQLYWVVGGISEVVRAIESRLTADVRYNSRVHSIGRTVDGRHLVTLDSGRQGAFDAVFCCLPQHWLATLEWDDTDLAAVMTDHVAHYDHPGHYLRISLEFKEPWWKPWGMPGCFWMSDWCGGCCVYDESTRWACGPGHVLSILVAGNDAMTLVSANQFDEELIEQALASFPREFREAAKAMFVEGAVHRWIGSLSAQPGSWPAEELRGEHQPEWRVDAGLFLIGDYLFDSTLNGALISAETATDLAVKHLTGGARLATVETPTGPGSPM